MGQFLPGPHFGPPLSQPVYGTPLLPSSSPPPTSVAGSTDIIHHSPNLAPVGNLVDAVAGVSRVWCVQICADIPVGNQMIRGISGGQKKRVTTGEPPLLCGICRCWTLPVRHSSLTHLPPPTPPPHSHLTSSPTLVKYWQPISPPSPCPSANASFFFQSPLKTLVLSLIYHSIVTCQANCASRSSNRCL